MLRWFRYAKRTAEQMPSGEVQEMTMIVLREVEIDRGRIDER